ncbi:hypothetical protein T552_00967 [Pneumocystis carinii B80]|uniref:Pre-mRNA-processing protein 45 n=1 Tax=Pneumocystis carinii (strain B80) TaxID=1408658 RepID=A0A0W4ZN14_PNEC8|nr:hypothetical protein T552_00967 [Pneumocystis carinii B80]KTW29760.1 hypothetical protein T552_00967 [Pneumocystis carinii B80]
MEVAYPPVFGLETRLNGEKTALKEAFLSSNGENKVMNERGLISAKIPPYGQRKGWIPKRMEDFEDGGAFPEILVAQYPLQMGLKKMTAGAALAIQVDAEGNIRYDAIARQGHDPDRIVHSSFKSLIPLRQRADIGEISLERPSIEEVEATTERTRRALEKIITGQIAASKPKTIQTQEKHEPTFVRYTPCNQMGETADVVHRQRIIKMVEMPQDPMEPLKFRHKKIPRGPPSPPAPVMHSPPRKLTAKEQQEWVIPPSISNWKNAKGYTIPLDKRLIADGRGMMDVQINDNFSKLSEALYAADRHAREEVRKRAQLQHKIAQKEKDAKKEHLQELARKVREERHMSQQKDPSNASEATQSDEDENSEDERAAKERENLRRERRRDVERQMRMSRMGAEQRLKVMAREQNRDISEKIALGLAKPTLSKDSLFDNRLFNQTAGLDSGFKDDDTYNIYDKPLFATAAAVQSIYRPKANDIDENPDEELNRVTRESRFEVLGKATHGFKGADLAEPRDGPVQFEKEADPFGIDAFIASAAANAYAKRNLGLDTSTTKNSKKTKLEDNQ